MYYPVNNRIRSRKLSTLLSKSVFVCICILVLFILFREMHETSYERNREKNSNQKGNSIQPINTLLRTRRRYCLLGDNVAKVTWECLKTHINGQNRRGFRSNKLRVVVFWKYTRRGRVIRHASNSPCC